MNILDVKNLTMRFGGLVAVDNLSFSIAENSISSLIGPNGAGKTSAFNCLTGFYKASEGEIIFQGTNVVKKKPYVITYLGMARTFQNLRLFKNMTVLENAMAGMHNRTKSGILGAIFYNKNQVNEEAEIKKQSLACLEFVGILDKKDKLACNLSYGDQRRLEWARAIATQPKLILLDEPAAGLNHDEKEQLIKLIKRIRDELKITVLLIEHDMGLVMKISEHIIVLDYGRKIAEGNADKIKNDPRVIEAYLGKDEDDAI